MVVCLKQVPDATEVTIDPKTNTLVREGVPSIINPYDVHAVEAALQLKDMYGGKVTVLTMGPPQAEESLKKAIAYGADEAILLSDRKFAGSDTLATSYILAQAIRKLGESDPVDIIFCGKQAIDGDTAQVGPGIATRLGIPQLTYVIKIDEVDLEKGEIQIHRKLEALREVVRAKLPALLTVEKSLNEIRYASLPNMIKAATFKVTVLGKDSFEMNEAELGLKGSPTWVSKIFAPPQREVGELLSGGESAVPELVDRLVKTKIIANI
jgi:electron transfer flavoprotein beta subunit